MSRLLLRLVGRELWRGELRAVVLALALSVACVLSVALVADRLQQTLTQGGREFLAGDLQLRSAETVPDTWLAAARQQGLAWSQTLVFNSMLFHEDALQLASIKAVGPGYPFYGQLQLEPPATVAAGRIWLSPELMQRLQVAVGQTVELGELELQVAGRVLQTPDEGFSPVLLAPRALIDLADAERSGLLLPGSRLSYRYQFQGPAAALAAWQAEVKPQLKPGQQLVGPGQGEGMMSQSLARSERFFRLAALIGLLLGCMAISLAMGRFAQRQQDMMALLKVLGARRRTLWGLMSGLLLAVALVGGLLGGVAGMLLQQGFILLLGDLLPKTLPSPGPWPFVLGGLLAVLATVLLSLWPFLQLLKVPPLRVLRQGLKPGLPDWLGLPVLLLGALLLCWLVTGDGPLTLALLAGLLLVGLVLTLLVRLLLWLLPRGRPGSGLALAVRQLRRQGWRSALQAQVLALPLMLLGLLLGVRQALLSDLWTQLPADAPNRFVLNIAPQDKAPLDRLLAAHGIAAPTYYPVLRGRLTAINDEPVTQQEGELGREGIHRELTVTWLAQLPAHNRLLAGAWWQAGQGQQVSVESDVATRLGIGLGDWLSFDLAGQAVRARVSSLRQVNWQDLQPNFFMIFSPDLFAEQPSSAMASLRLSPDSALERELVRQFPALTLINVDELMAKLQAMSERIGKALGLMAALITLAGLLVLLVQVQAELARRRPSLVLMRTLGASAGQLKGALRWELLTLGALAGLAAALGAEVALRLSHQLWSLLPWRSLPALWLGLPVMGALLVWLTTSLMVAQQLRQALGARLRAF
ncbi:ABC transporter permease [Pseudaeromonas paramecii]|uniref:FtsX-like permease family protein n=1 Tax=Pseudaeromonas paramecii TaxID=2138166 RepID=A0ABP8Q6A5_9GAMM